MQDHRHTLLQGTQVQQPVPPPPEGANHILMIQQPVPPRDAPSPNPEKFSGELKFPPSGSPNSRTLAPPLTPTYSVLDLRSASPFSLPRQCRVTRPVHSRIFPHPPSSRVLPKIQSTPYIGEHSSTPTTASRIRRHPPAYLHKSRTSIQPYSARIRRNLSPHLRQPAQATPSSATSSTSSLPPSLGHSVSE
ncbi:hypothetical protein CRENBAI_020228 [Crenichthys baileyi]|uniref:Movement protein n=1 Tax=Crenichthys baileyi TaxID=28760 RepID=A0AAV9S3W2_9TELE